MSPSLVREAEGTVNSYVRLQAPGQLDPNHIDGIGALWLVSHLPAGAVGAVGALDLRDAEIDITVRGTDFQANGAKLVFWICTYLPDSDVVYGFPVGVQITNWAYTGGDFAGQISEEWQTITVKIDADPADWTYAGNNVSGQGDWADRYAYLDLDTALRNVDATLHLALVTDSPSDRPSGFLDIADITIRTQTPAMSSGAPAPAYVGYGIEDEPLLGTLPVPAGVNGASFALVAGSVRNGSVSLDAVTGAFTFTPSADYYGPASNSGPAGFNYAVTDASGVRTVHTAYLYIAPINDAPAVMGIDEDFRIAYESPFTMSLFKGEDVDGDLLTFHVVEDSVRNGTLVLDSATGRYSFTPNQGFSGEAGFAYYVSDGQASSAPKSVVLEVAGPNQPVTLSYADALARLSAGDVEGFAKIAIRVADAGDPNAAYHYGTFLMYGRFVQQDTALAAHYLDLAKDVVPDARISLANLYIAGNGVARDYAMARSLLESVGQLAEAQYRLGLLDRLGFGGPQDDAAAQAHFLAAAKLGHAEAMVSLGRSYLFGSDVRVSDAYFWLGVSLRMNAPSLAPAQSLLQANKAQAGAGLSNEFRTALDVVIAGWQPGDAVPVTGNGTLLGTDRADYLIGGASSDYLIGRDGADTLVGGAGLPNVLQGGRGNDVYIVSAAGDSIIEFADEGLDEVRTTLAIYSLPANVENLTAIDSGPHSALIGNELDNVIRGNTGRDEIHGREGNDTLYDGGGNGADALIGGPGNDIYYVENRYSSTLEAAGEGIDEVRTTLPVYRLQANVENLTFIDAGVHTGIGNELDNVLRGNTGSDTLFGGAGNDTLYGGTGAANTMFGQEGDDLYYVDAVGDSVKELPGEGIDEVRTGLSVYTLPANVENLTLTNTAPHAAAVGNALDNVIRGNTGRDAIYGREGNDTLYDGGGDGIDTLVGGPGNDIYYVENRYSSTYELANEGIDEVRTTLSVYRLQANVENLTAIDNGPHSALIGNALDNVITGGTGSDDLFGGEGNDTLKGGTGAANTMFGGPGNDIYYVEAVGDSVKELPGEGIDQVYTPLPSFVMPDNVEQLAYIGTGSFVGIGNNQSNVLRGGDGNDILSGLGGDDVIIGGSGADELQGGDGPDQFRYLGGETGFDRILDFTSGSDKIVLMGSGFAHTASFEFMQGAGTPTPGTGNSTFLYDSTNGMLSYDPDGFGGTAPIVLAQLNPGLTLSAGDFLILT